MLSWGRGLLHVAQLSLHKYIINRKALKQHCIKHFTVGCIFDILHLESKKPNYKHTSADCVREAKTREKEKH